MNQNLLLFLAFCFQQILFRDNILIIYSVQLFNLSVVFICDIHLRIHEPKVGLSRKTAIYLLRSQNTIKNKNWKSSNQNNPNAVILLHFHESLVSKRCSLCNACWFPSQYLLKTYQRDTSVLGNHLAIWNIFMIASLYNYGRNSKSWFGCKVHDQ